RDRRDERQRVPRHGHDRAHRESPRRDLRPLLQGRPHRAGSSRDQADAALHDPDRPSVRRCRALSGACRHGGDPPDGQVGGDDRRASQDRQGTGSGQVSAAPAAGLDGRRILVTGGSGFIGRHVVSDLRGAGAHVRVVDLQAHPDPDVEIVRGDIAERDVLDAALAGGLDGVVHLAAVTSVLRSLEHPELTYRTNVAATASLLEAARAAGATALVFASTNAVTGPMEAPAISEAATLRPLTPYGATKAAGEMLMSACTASYGLRCAAMRLTNVYGPGMQAKDSIVARLMRAIRLEQGFEIYGDGRQVRDYVHAADVTAAVRLGLGADGWGG